MQINRVIEKKLENHFGRYKQVLVLLGARQVGKSTLLKRLFPNGNYLLLDLEEVKKVFETYNLATYKNLLGQHKQIILDEIHLLSNPGRAIKIIYDLLPDLQMIATGSSSFHIKNKTSESLAGRKIEYHLYPLTFGEYLFQIGSERTIQTPFVQNIKDGYEGQKRFYNMKELLRHVLSYGLYPGLLNISNKSEYLSELSSSAVFKDIVELNLIENKAKAKELLKLLAYQIGNLINYEEIATKLSIDRRTVERYIEIFEESYLIYRLYPYSRNSRKEIGKAPKIYFWDIGLRNAIIKNFDDVNIRTDGGAIFENFVINEIKKEIDYLDLDYNVNYWRLKSGPEVDLVLSNNYELVGCEINLTEGKFSKAFTSRYSEAKTHVISSKNVLFRLPPYYTNQRKTLSKLNKVYFYDLGIRNALINNFNSLDKRSDVGGLWENFIIVERMKLRKYGGRYANQYFWKTYDGSEIDLVEQVAEKLNGYEIKWGRERTSPKSWLEYPNSSYEVVNKENFKDFLEI